MKFKWSILSLLLVMIVSTARLHAQDPQFSQYYSAPLYLNPGFAGSTNQQRIVFNHRLQWPNLPQAFSTFSFSYEAYVDKLKSGFGVLATTDKMGSAGWRTTYAGLLYSYKVRLSKKWVFSPGIYFAYGTNGMDKSKLRLRDGLEIDGQSLDPDIDRLGSRAFFDFSSGALFYNKNVWFGVSAYHLNQPNLSLFGEESRLNAKINIHGGAKIPLYNGPRMRASKISYLTPSFVYRLQGDAQQFDIGLQYHRDPIGVGVWYRGLPIQQVIKFEDSEAAVNQQDALVFIVSLNLRDLQIGYSYDYTLSELSGAAGGAHEVSLVWEFMKRSVRPGLRRRTRLIPCPSFNTNSDLWN